MKRRRERLSRLLLAVTIGLCSCNGNEGDAQQRDDIAADTAVQVTAPADLVPRNDSLVHPHETKGAQER